MDHHCPFTLTCVGLHNFAYFYLFLFYVTFGDLYATVMSFVPFYRCNFVELDTMLQDETDQCTSLGMYVFVLVPALFVFTFLISFFLFQTVILICDTPTVDVIRNLRKYGFSSVSMAWKCFLSFPCRSSQRRGSARDVCALSVRLWILGCGTW